jgi:hypothetical protein
MSGIRQASPGTDEIDAALAEGASFLANYREERAFSQSFRLWHFPLNRARLALWTSFRFLVDQDGLLPPARRLVGPVNATHPAARPLLSFQQFLAGSLDAVCAGFRLFGVLDPANELVAAERGQALPERENFRI